MWDKNKKSFALLYLNYVCVFIKLWKYGRESFYEFPRLPREDTHLNLATREKYKNDKKNFHKDCDEWKM